MDGEMLPSPVQIGLTDLQNIGGASGPPGPPGSSITAKLYLHLRIKYFFIRQSLITDNEEISDFKTVSVSQRKNLLD